MTGVFVDGKWQTINMAYIHGSVMGYEKYHGVYCHGDSWRHCCFHHLATGDVG